MTTTQGAVTCVRCLVMFVGSWVALDTNAALGLLERPLVAFKATSLLLLSRSNGVVPR